MKKKLVIFLSLIFIIGDVLADDVSGSAFVSPVATGGSLGSGSSGLSSGLDNSSPAINNQQINSNNVPAISSIIQQSDASSVKEPRIIGAYDASYSDKSVLNSGELSNNLQANQLGRFKDRQIVTKPDDFQLNVYARTGLKLNRYGYNLFDDPSTFAPINTLPASNNYILGPGDQINIKAWGAIDVEYTATVDKDGNIFIPRVGNISVTGVKVSNLESYLKANIGKIYRNFTLSATVSKIKSIQINVTGFAKRPGTYLVSSLATLTNAVFASGGPSPQGSLRHILLKRNGVVVADYDMYNLLLNGNDSGDIRLLPGDVIYISAYGQQVAIYDGVKVPGVYEAKKGDTVENIVEFAGGYTFNNTKRDVIVERIIENYKINVYNFKFNDGLKELVNNGDIIHFFRMPNRYDDAIVLIGNIANPSRFSWRNGITIKDIIPNKDVLLTKSFWDSYSFNTYAKDSMADRIGVEKTSNWSSRGGNTGSFSSGLNNSSNNGTSTINAFGGGDNLFTAGPVSIPEADINWHYAVIVRIDRNTYQSKLIPFDLEKAIKGDSSENHKLEPGDIVNILSAKDVRGPARQGVLYVFIDGEVNRPGVYELKPGSNLVDAIKSAGGITSDAYLYGLELARDSVKKRQMVALNQMLDNIQQNLLSEASRSTSNAISNDAITMHNQVLKQQQAFIDKLRQLKPTGRIILDLRPNLSLAALPKVSLENGDTIHIPAVLNTIDVIGQVYNPATFVYDKSSSVGDYVNKAGTANNFADTSSIYVMHADGTLYSKQQAGWFGQFASLKPYPGDAIIVPQKIDFTTLKKDMMDWTQILANLGFGIAAVKQLGS